MWSHIYISANAFSFENWYLFRRDYDCWFFLFYVIHFNNKIDVFSNWSVLQKELKCGFGTVFFKWIANLVKKNFFFLEHIPLIKQAAPGRKTSPFLLLLNLSDFNLKPNLSLESHSRLADIKDCLPFTKVLLRIYSVINEKFLPLLTQTMQKSNRPISNSNPDKNTDRSVVFSVCPFSALFRPPYNLVVVNQWNTFCLWFSFTFTTTGSSFLFHPHFHSLAF